MSNFAPTARWAARSVGFCAGLLGLIGSAAAVPSTLLVEGVLTSTGGAPAVDGDYNITFSTWDAATNGAQLWKEGPTKVTILGGRFQVAIGGATPLSAKALPDGGAWLGVAVASDPELPRQALHSAPYAVFAGSAASLTCSGCVGADAIANGSIAAAKLGFNYAGSAVKGGPASDLECTGCVSVAEIAFDGDVDLKGASIKAKNGTFAGDVVAKTVTATELIGDGSKITGIKLPVGACKAGEALTGINADGTLKCAAVGLVPDGLNEVSNDLLSNQFIDTIGATDKAVAIPDNTGAEAISNLAFPDIGTAQTFAVNIEVANTDLSTMALVLLPPDDKKVGYTICDPCGDKDAKSLKIELPKTAPKSGDLSTWIGKNPKGAWTLKAKDTAYCIVQAPGNDKLCDTTNKLDGTIVDWSITIQTLSNKKVSMTGDFLVSGKVTADNGTGAGTVPVANGKQQVGLIADRAELAGNNWKQCTWKDINDGKDVGQVVECPYTKKYDNTALRVVWNGTLRSAYQCNACCTRWYFTIDGKECAKPGAIDAVAYTWHADGTGTDLHHNRLIEGFCSDNTDGPIKKGDIKIGFWIGTCGGYGVTDGYTGWNSTSRIIVEEVPM